MSGKDAVCGSQSRQDLTKIKECIREDIIRCMNRERVVSDEEIKDMIQQRVGQDDLTLQGKYFLSLANYFVGRVAGNLIGEGLPHAGQKCFQTG